MVEDRLGVDHLPALQGIPLGYEVFAGNRNDVKTWREIVETMEARYGKANRIWCGDRGMMSRENIAFMEEGDRRYIIGVSKEAGLGDEPRRVFEQLGRISLVDVVMPTRVPKTEIRRRCVARPSEHQAILLERLGLRLPNQIHN